MKFQSLPLFTLLALVVSQIPALAADESADTSPTTPAKISVYAAAPPTPRAEIAGALMKYYGAGPTEADIVDPQPEVEAEVDMGDHIRRTISYNVDKGERVKAYLLLPKPLPTAASKRPLVLCPHPTNNLGKDSVIGNYPVPPVDEEEAAYRGSRTYALDLVRHGFICFAPDRWAFGERAVLPDETSARKQMAAYSEQLDLRWPGWGGKNGKQVWDLQRALDFLLEYDFIDSERVACIGHSLGAWDTMLLTPVDDRVKIAVANAPGTMRFERAMWTDLEARARQLADPSGGLPRNFNLMLMGIAPRPFLYLRAINDSYEKGQPTMLEAYRLLVDYYRQAAGNKDNTWRAPVGIYFHSDGHSFEPEAKALAYRWIELRMEELAKE